MKKILGALFLAFTLSLSAAGCAVPEDGTTAADRSDANTKGDKGDKGDKSDKSTKDDAPKETAGQENARESAESYLDMTAYSREGLIEQLKYEKYSDKDATYGVDAQKADWNVQAAASAESYLDMTSYSRDGLIEQLMYEGYTRPQAEYGAKKAGL